MKKLILSTCAIGILSILSGCDTLQELSKQNGLPNFPSIPNVNIPLSNEEVIKGLKSALHVGTDTSISILGRTNGYFSDALIKLALPPEAQPIVNNITKIPGGQKLLNDAILAINRAAEDAAPQAKTIFVSAITGITIADGFNILKGGNNAATTYLKNQTYNQLTDAFAPRIRTSLSKPLVLGISAESAYKSLIDGYNKASMNGLLFQQIKQNSLATYTTQKALDGLFLKVANEETKIRQDVSHRINDILKRVFGK
jgi:hypothetical protein